MTALSWSLGGKKKTILVDGFMQDRHGCYGCCDDITEDTNIEFWLSRTIQALSFTICFEFSSHWTDKNFWNGVQFELYPMSSAAHHALYLCSITACLFWFTLFAQKAFNRMCGHFCLPPYIDDVSTSTKLRLATESTVIQNYLIGCCTGASPTH